VGLGTVGWVKPCTKCGITKPLDDFYRDSKDTTRYRTQCKQCYSDYAKERREQNPNHRREYNRQYAVQWRERHADDLASYQKKWREQNADTRAQYRQKNKQRSKEYSRHHYITNRERRLEQLKRYNRENPEVHKQVIRRRRARKNGAVQQRWVVDSSLGVPGLCWWCGTHLDPERTHIDHVMPISLGGPAKPSNEVLACQLCNQRKNRKHPLVWVAELVTQEGEPE
jgi:hypothetical protein